VKASYHSGVISLLGRFAKEYEIAFRGKNSWPLLRRTPGPKFLILCYHRVGFGGVPLYSELPPDLFEAQMRFLKRHYRLMSLDDVCREMKDPTSTEPGVAITFDDGYRDLYHHAFPVLRKYQIPATIYLIAESMTTGNVAWYDRIFLALQLLRAEKLEIELDAPRSFELTSPQSRFHAALEIISSLRRLPNSRRKSSCADIESRLDLPEADLRDRILNWEQVQAMQETGVSFGSHTITHPVVSQLTPSDMLAELVESKRMLEAGLRAPVRHFAFPFGHANDICREAMDMLAESDYLSGATTIPGVNQPGANPMALRRVQIGEEHNLPMFASTVSQFFLLAETERRDGNRESSPLTADTASLRSRVAEGSRHA